MLKKALELFAFASYENEIFAHEFVDYDREDLREVLTERQEKHKKLIAAEQAAADLVETLSGNRPEFFDQGGFLDGGRGVISFIYAGLEFDFDGEELKLA